MRATRRDAGLLLIEPLTCASREFQRPQYTRSQMRPRDRRMGKSSLEAGGNQPQGSGRFKSGTRRARLMLRHDVIRFGVICLRVHPVTNATTSIPTTLWLSIGRSKMQPAAFWLLPDWSEPRETSVGGRRRKLGSLTCGVEMESCFVQWQHGRPLSGHGQRGRARKVRRRLKTSVHPVIAVPAKRLGARQNGQVKSVTTCLDR